jgi:hypothetical protein
VVEPTRLTELFGLTELLGPTELFQVTELLVVRAASRFWVLLHAPRASAGIMEPEMRRDERTFIAALRDGETDEYPQPRRATGNP